MIPLRSLWIPKLDRIVNPAGNGAIDVDTCENEE
jgi:hypothetical protein